MSGLQAPGLLGQDQAFCCFVMSVLGLFSAWMGEWVTTVCSPDANVHLNTMIPNPLAAAGLQTHLVCDRNLRAMIIIF